MDNRYPPPEEHTVANGVKNAFFIYGVIAVIAFAIGWMMG